MTINTWEQEFYPITAKEAVKKLNSNPLGLLVHEIRVWEGLDEEALKRHKLIITEDGKLQDINNPCSKIGIDSDNSALCTAFMDFSLELEHECQKCPIYTVTGKSCDDQYIDFQQTQSNKPMLELLNKVRQQLENNSKP